MQITLQESEILDALEDYVRSKISISESQKIIFDLKAGRGENGFTATLDIVANGSKAPVKSKPVSKPTFSKPEKENEPVLVDDGPADITAEVDDADETPPSEMTPKVSIFGKSA